MWQVTQGLGHRDWPRRDAGPPQTPSRTLSGLPPTPLKSSTRGCWSAGRVDPRTGSRALPRPLWTADSVPGLGLQGADFPRPGQQGAWTPGQGAELCPDPSGRQTLPRGWACKGLTSQDLSGSYWRSQPRDQVCVTSPSHRAWDEALLRSHRFQAGSGTGVAGQSPHSILACSWEAPGPQSTRDFRPDPTRLLPVGQCSGCCCEGPQVGR